MTEQPVELSSKKKNVERMLALHKKGILATARAAAEIGDVVMDGTVYAGISPTTGKRIFVAPKDAPFIKTFNEAAEYAEAFEIGGQKDFRLPDKAELNVIFENKDKGALKNTFRKVMGGSAPWYCSSTPDGDDKVWVQLFVAGQQIADSKDNRTSVRCIRL